MPRLTSGSGYYSGKRYPLWVPTGSNKYSVSSNKSTMVGILCDILTWGICMEGGWLGAVELTCEYNWGYLQYLLEAHVEHLGGEV